MDVLKSDNASLKADVEKNAKELKLDLENALKISHMEIMGHVDELDSHLTKIEKSTMAVPDLDQTVTRNMNKNSDELKQVDAEVTLNSANIVVLKNSMKILEQ